MGLFFGKCAICKIEADLSVLFDERMICEDCHREMKGSDYVPPPPVFIVRNIPHYGTIGDDGVIDAGDAEN